MSTEAKRPPAQKRPEKGAAANNGSDGKAANDPAQTTV
jgi:hypothetical protein